jgi:hypothetical protein
MDMVLEARKAAEFEDSTLTIPCMDGTSIVVSSISYHLKNIGYLFFVSHDVESMYRILNFSSILGSALRNLLTTGTSIGNYSGNSAFQSLVSDLIELKIENMDEIKTRLEFMNL